MLTTFTYTIRVLVRNKAVLLWAVVFPLVLSTLFYSMFHNLDETYVLDPIPVVVVQDANYAKDGPFAEMIAALAEPGTLADPGTLAEPGTGAQQQAMLAPTYVSSAAEARDLLTDGYYYGYIVLDSQGLPEYFMDARYAGGLDTIDSVKQSIVVSLLDRYIQDYQLIQGIAATSPEAFASSEWMEALLAEPTYIVEGSLTANEPSDSIKYYYAALAFSSMQMMVIGLAAIETWRINASALGARRALGGQSWIRSLAPTLLAAWVLALGCLLVGFAYIRFVFQASFGGKELACIGVLAVSSLTSTFIGALLVTLPLPAGAVSGLTAFVSCVMSIFAGLYGPASQELGDYVARELPLLSTLNPARQVYEAFYSLYFYDGYSHLLEVVAVLAVMTLVLFGGTVLMMRRQRYRSL